MPKPCFCGFENYATAGKHPLFPSAFVVLGAASIVEAIVTGTQPVELTLDRILRSGTLPLTWHEQRRHLGFPTA